MEGILMPIFDTGMIPFNKGFDERDPQYKPNGAVDQVVNFLGTTNGFYRRPPWELKLDFIPDLHQEYEAYLIEAFSEPSYNSTQVSIKQLKLESMDLEISGVVDERVIVLARVSYSTSYESLGLFIYSESYGSFNLEQSKFAEWSYDYIPQILNLDSNDIVAIPRNFFSYNTASSDPLPSVLLYFDGPILEGTYELSMTYKAYSTKPNYVNSTITIIVSDNGDGTFQYDTETIVAGTFVDTDSITVDAATIQTLNSTLHDKLTFFGTSSDLLDGYKIVIPNNEVSDQLIGYGTMTGPSQGHFYNRKVPAISVLPQAKVPGGVLSLKFGIGEFNKDVFWVKTNEDGEWVETNKAVDMSWDDATNSVVISYPDTLINPSLLDYKTTDYSRIIPYKDLAPRYVGDGDTAPMPSIVDYEVKDIFMFQSRLCFLTEKTLVCSRVNDEFNLFPETATELLPTDPIDIIIGDNLQYAEVFNNGIMIFGKNKQYYLTSGGQQFNSTTISVTPTTKYSVSKFRPISTGDSLMFTDADGNIIEYSSRYEVAQTMGYKINDNFGMMNIKLGPDCDHYSPFDTQSFDPIITRDKQWVFFPSSRMIALNLNRQGDNLVRIPSSIDYSVVTPYSKPIDIISFKSYIVTLQSVNGSSIVYLRTLDLDYIPMKHYSYPPYIDDIIDPTVAPFIIDFIYDSNSDETVVNVDIDYIGRISVGFRTDTETMVDPIRTNAYDSQGVYQLVFSGDMTSVSDFLMGIRYGSLVYVDKYIPRDSNGNPMSFKRLTYRLGEIYYSGISFDINTNYYSGNDLNVSGVFTTSLLDTPSIETKAFKFYLRGYDDVNLNISTITPYPLFLKGIRYEFRYFRGR